MSKVIGASFGLSGSFRSFHEPRAGPAGPIHRPVLQGQMVTISFTFGFGFTDSEAVLSNEISLKDSSISHSFAQAR